MSKYFEFAKLIRPYGLLYLGLTPVFSALCNNMFDFFHLLILFFIGVFLHIFTFVQNDIFDIKVDSRSAYVSKRPLVTGLISKKEATILVDFSFIIAVIFTIVFVFKILSLIFLLLSFLFVSLYNKYSKKFSFMEYVLSIGVFTFGLFGAFTVSNSISVLAVIVCLFSSIQWLFSVGVFANLKDVEYDSKDGIKTTPTVLGVKIENNNMIVPVGFRVYAFGIKILHILIAALPFLFGLTSIYTNSLPIPLILFIVLSMVIIFLLKKILSTPLSKRERMLIYEGLQEGLAFLLIPVILLNYLIENIGVYTVVLLVAFMIIWPLACFRLFFGKKMIPLE